MVITRCYIFYPNIVALFTHVVYRYFLYLEDDWLLSSPLVSTGSLGRALEGISLISRLGSTEAILRCSNHSIEDSFSEYSEAGCFVFLLLAARTVLKESSDMVETYTYMNTTRTVRESLHQVLFNEQSTRACAEGSDQCNVSTLGHGGWPRTSSSGIPYALHEFGLLDVPEAFGDRLHEFSYWPGLSFNPGLWDIGKIRQTLWRCKYDSDNVFSETDDEFEHRFSMVAHACGLRMGYFPSVFFSHIGNISAYKLSNISRSFDLIR